MSEPNPYALGPGAPWLRPPDHPQATTVLVLGVLSIAVCQLTGPFAWVMGKRALAEIDASGGRIGGRSQVQVGYVLGIVGTVLLGLALVFLAIYAVVLVGFLTTATTQG